MDQVKINHVTFEEKVNGLKATAMHIICSIFRHVKTPSKCLT